MTANETIAAFGDQTANTIHPVFAVIVGAAAVAGIGMLVLTSAARFRRLQAFLGLAAESVHYFGIGLLALVPVALVGWAGYAFANAETTTQTNLAKYISGGIAAYIAISGLGYVLKRLITALKAELAPVNAPAEGEGGA